MNERIRELAVQSGLKVESWMTNPPTPFQILGSVEEFEKFAELIVKECIRRCEGNGEYKNHSDTDWGKGLAAGIEMCKTIIQTTFRS